MKIYACATVCLLMVTLGCGAKSPAPAPSTQPQKPPPRVEVTEKDIKDMTDPAAEMFGPDQDKVRVISNTAYCDEQDPRLGVIVGEFQNLSRDRTIKMLALRFDVMNGEQVVCGTETFTMEYVPPGASVKYSVKYYLPGPGTYLRAVPKVEYAPEGTVCWMVDSESCRWEMVGGTTRKISGRVENDTDGPARDVAIYISLYDSQNQLVAHIPPVKLEDGKTSLGKGLKGRFVVQYDTRGKKPFVPAEDIKFAEIWLVGKK